MLKVFRIEIIVLVVFISSLVNASSENSEPLSENDGASTKTSRYQEDESLSSKESKNVDSLTQQQKKRLYGRERRESARKINRYRAYNNN